MRCSEIINNCSKEEINVFSKRVTNTNRVHFCISLKSSEKEQIESKFNKSNIREFLDELLTLYVTNVDIVSLPLKNMANLQPRKKKRQGREYVTKSLYIEADTFLKIKMNFSINYLRELLDTDYDFKIYTENNVKVIETKYGKYYSHVLDEATLFRSLVHMRACMLNKELNNGR